MKNLLVLFVLLMFATITNAQLFKIFGQEVGYIYVGPKIGGAFSKISNADESWGAQKTIYKPGVQFGIVGKIGITSRFSIQPELNFYQKGVKYDITGGSEKFKTNYIGIPLLAKFALAKIGVVNIHVDGGVYSNVRTSGTRVTEWGGSETIEQDVDNSGWRRMDYGFALGGGCEYQQKKGTWVLDLRYDYSFVDIHKDDAAFNSNRTFGISVTYLFDVVDFYFRLKNKNQAEQPQPEQK